MQIMCISRWTAFCSFKPSHGVDGFTTIQRWRRNASLRVNSERWVWWLICLARPRYDGGQWVMSDCLLCPKARWALSKNGLQITKKNRQTKTSGETPEYMVPMPGILGRANQGLVLLTALVLEMQFHPYKDNRPMVEIAELFSTGARLAIRKMDSRTFQVSELLHTHIDR